MLGGTAGHSSKNRYCPDRFGTVDRYDTEDPRSECTAVRNRINGTESRNFSTQLYNANCNEWRVPCGYSFHACVKVKSQDLYSVCGHKGHIRMTTPTYVWRNPRGQVMPLVTTYWKL